MCSSRMSQYRMHLAVECGADGCCTVVIIRPHRSIGMWDLHDSTMSY